MGKRGPNLPAIRRVLGDAAAVHRGQTSVEGRANPIVSAVQFSNATRAGGGATMNATTMNLRPVGPDGPGGYAVGGMQGTNSHHRIPTVDAPAPNRNVRLDTVLQQARRVRRLTPGQEANAHVGSWLTTNGVRGRVDMDASEVEPDLAKAKAKGIRRGEDAIFDLKNVRDIELPTSRKRKKA